ncbi:hypothetical protein QL093DRAFT_2439368 [Fusarium oxysporum]|nr:hypothetical protein QL093DRAFT_2439368 [Fusarium oxysporum]
MVSKRTKPGCLLPLISSQERILFLALGLGICKHHPLHAKHTEARETPWLSEITNEWALQACRSATALGKRNGHGETQRLHPMNRTMVRAIRKLGRRRCRVPTKCRSAAHTEREEKRRAFRRGYHHRSICSDQVAYTEGQVGWRGARSRLVFAYLLHCPSQTPDRRAKREKDLHIRLTEVGLARN